MPLKLLPAVTSDVPELISVWDVAFKDTSALDSIFFPRTPAAWAFWTSAYESDFAHPSARFVKVVDTGTGVIAGFAKWYVPVPMPAGISASTATDEKNNETHWSVGGADPDEIEGAEWPEGYNVRLSREIFGAFAAARRRIMGQPLRPHYYLERIGVRPEYRGSGAGGMLIRWGLQRADEEGREAYVEALDSVVKYYKKFGWRPVEKYENKEIGHVETFMRRPTKREVD